MTDRFEHSGRQRIVASPDLSSWAAMAAEAIETSISEAIESRGVCHLMLTGGNTAERLYAHWAKTSALPLDRIRFLFGDERCVPPDSLDSNYALVVKVLFLYNVPNDCSISRMDGENSDREAAAKAYEKLLPEAVDVLLLGLGTDGHIASLFPHNSAMRAGQRTVVPVMGPMHPYERLTITPRVIACARSVFVLATGAEKGRVLAEAIISPADTMSMPVRLAMGGTWLLDTEAQCQLSSQGE